MRQPLYFSTILVFLLLQSLTRLVDATMAISQRLDPVMMRMAYGQMVKRKDENLQIFKGSMGAAAPAITDTGSTDRPFGVDGDSFPDFDTAGQRSCGNQFNSCQLMANSNQKSNFTVKDCQNQQDQCNSVLKTAAVTKFAVAAAATSTTSTTTSTAAEAQETFPFDDEFELVCDVPGV